VAEFESKERERERESEKEELAKLIPFVIILRASFARPTGRTATGGEAN